MDHNQLFIPDFGLNDSEKRGFTPPHAYKQIIVPTLGIDRIFNQKLADVMEWSMQNQSEAANLEFLIAECYRQMGECYNHNHIAFFHTLQGNPGEAGVSGYPAFVNLSHFDFTGPKYINFVTLFRHYALEFFATVNPNAQSFPGMEFLYHKYIYGGWVFFLYQRPYDAL